MDEPVSYCTSVTSTLDSRNKRTKAPRYERVQRRYDRGRADPAGLAGAP